MMKLLPVFLVFGLCAKAQSQDSLKYIENLFGLKLENVTTERGSGIKIINAGQIKKFSAFAPSPEGSMIVGVGQFRIGRGVKRKDIIRTENTSQFTKALFQLRSNGTNDACIVVTQEKSGYSKQVYRVYSLMIGPLDVNAKLSSQAPLTLSTNTSQDTTTKQNTVQQTKTQDTTTASASQSVKSYVYLGASYCPNGAVNGYGIGNAQDFYSNMQTQSGVWCQSDGISQLAGTGGFYHIYLGFMGGAKNRIGLELGFGKTASRAIAGRTDIGLCTFSLHPVEATFNLTYFDFAFSYMHPLSEKKKIFFVFKTNIIYGFMGGQLIFPDNATIYEVKNSNVGAKFEAGLNFGKRSSFFFRAGFRLLSIEEAHINPSTGAKEFFGLNPYDPNDFTRVKVNWSGLYMTVGVDLFSKGNSKHGFTR